MKNRNRWIVGLLLIGIALYAVIQFFVIPRREAEHRQYLTAQQEPATHDLSTVLPCKNKYMGNASNDADLFYHLPMGDTGISFELLPEKLTLEVNYKDTVWNIGEDKVKRSLLYNSTAAFALIDNLQEIDYNFSGASYRVKRAGIESLYPNFGDLLQSAQWKTSVQAKMNDTQFVDESFQKVFRS